MRSISAARWLIIGSLVVLHAPILAQASASQLPVSLDRIRAALKEPQPVLQVPVESGKTPIFRVDVRQPIWGLRPVEDERPFDPTMGLPSAGELLIDGIGKIHSDIVKYKRGRADRRAQKEVADALAALCALRDCPPEPTPK